MRKFPVRVVSVSLLVLGLGGILLTKDLRQPLPAYAANVQPVKVSQGSSCKTYQGSFLYSSAQAMLTHLGVSLYPTDRITAFPDPALGIGSAIKDCVTPTYYVDDAGITTTIRSWATTVTALATEQRLQLGNQDEVTPARDATIQTGSTITIVRVAQTQLAASVSLPFTIQYQDDPTLDKGKQQVKQAGKNGLRTDTYIVTRKDGAVTSTVKTSSQVVSAPVNEIISRGTKIEILGSGLASWYVGIAPYGAASLTLPMGTVITVTNVANGKSVTVTVDDRGPYVSNRVLDISKIAFEQIGSLGSGVVSVTYTKN